MLKALSLCHSSLDVHREPEARCRLLRSEVLGDNGAQLLYLVRGDHVALGYE